MNTSNVKKITSDFEPQSESLRPFLLVLLIGALVRVIVLPFFGHIDFLSEYSRIFAIQSEGNLFMGSRFITAITEYINYFLVSPLLAEESSMFRIYDYGNTTASHTQFFAFIEHHAIYRTFLLLKLPYLLFDLLGAVFLYNLFTERAQGLKAAAIWLFNPITFFAFHIFARYESIALFYIILSLFFAHKNKVLLSSVAFGLAIWSREINITLIPFFGLFVIRHPGVSTTRKISSLLLLIVFIGFTTNIIPSVLGMYNQFKGNAAVSVAGMKQSKTLLGFEIGWYYPFIVIYCLLFFKLLVSKTIDVFTLCKAITLYYCAFFIMVIHTVHYVSWLVPFFTILAARDTKFLVSFALFCCSWIIFWTFATDLGVFTHWLAIPGSLFFSSIPNIPSLLHVYILPHIAFELHHVVTAFRSLYAAALIFCAIQIFNESKNENKQN